MRTATAPQLVDLAARQRKELVRVKIANAADTLVDLSSHFFGGSFTVTLDAMAVSGNLSFWRQTADTNLAPLMNATAPIAPGRHITFEVAIIGTGDSVAGGDWVMLFDGLVDDVEWASEKITVTCRDAASILRDTWIESPAQYGNDSSPVAIETVMQSILDATIGAAVVTLDTIGNPDFGILLYEQQPQSLADALGALRDLIGWDLRYLWDDVASEFQLKFFEPDRDKTTADHNFTADDYFTLTEVAQSKRDVRNKISVRYADDLTVTAEDPESIAEFGTRFMFLDFINNNQISSEASALVLATAILGDTSQPALTHVAECALFWPAELGDLLQFTANEVHYNADQFVAVSGYTHTFGPDGNSTSVQCRGAPAGGSFRWFKHGQLARVTPDESFDEPEPETIQSADLQAFLTTGSGSAGYSTAQNDADDSLGGYISTTPAPAGLNGLFRLVTEPERVAGITLYRTIAFINNHGSLSWENVYGWLTTLGTGDATWSAGLDPIGIVDIDRAEKQSAECADEETAPVGVTFYEPTSIVHADAFNVGSVDPAMGFCIHIKQTVAAGATAQETYSRLYFTDTA